jgi:hypothetical protein
MRQSRGRRLARKLCARIRPPCDGDLCPALSMALGEDNISLDRTGDAGRVWLEWCILEWVARPEGAWPRPISSRALSFARRLISSYLLWMSTSRRSGRL